MLFQSPAGSSWTLNDPLPFLPQLAGVHCSVQAAYAPTASPIGFDLTNAVQGYFGH